MYVSNQVVSGVKWTSFSKIIRIVLQYVTLLILVAYLSPSDFGLMSTAMIFIGFFNLIKDFGFSAALIQLENKSEELLSSVFWLNVFIGILFSSFLFFGSGFIADFYNLSELRIIIEVLSINFLFNSTAALQNSLFEKEMNFNILSKIEIIATSLGAIVAIFLAISGYGVWALVFQTLTFSFLLLILNWHYSSFRPKFMFNMLEIKKVFDFGINLSGFNILNYFVRNADYFLIGKYLGMNELGFYSLAYRIMLFPIQNITAVVSRVLFPALSKIKNNNNEMRTVLKSVGQSIAFISFPLMIGFFVVNESFVLLFLGDKWEPIINLLYILVPIGMIQSVYTLAGAIFKSKNKTRLWFFWGIISAVITVLGFTIGLNWGILGVAVSYLLTNLILIYPGLKLAFNLIELKVYDYFSKILITLYISFAMGLAVYLLKILINDKISELYTFIIMVIFGVVAYAALSYKFNKKLMLQIISKLNISK